MHWTKVVLLYISKLHRWNYPCVFWKGNKELELSRLGQLPQKIFHLDDFPRVFFLVDPHAMPAGEHSGAIGAAFWSRRLGFASGLGPWVRFCLASTWIQVIEPTTSYLFHPFRCQGKAGDAEILRQLSRPVFVCGGVQGCRSWGKLTQKCTNIY